MYTNAKYLAEEPSGEPRIIKVFKNGKLSFIPLDPANSHYQEIMALVEAGELTIEPAD